MNKAKNSKNILLNEQIEINNKKIYNKEYDDFYFCNLNPFEESFHSFIKNIELDKNLLSENEINIAEIGYGTGVNLSTLLYFYKNQNKKVNFYSFEKYPLPTEICAYAHAMQKDLAEIFPLWKDLYNDNLGKNNIYQFNIFKNFKATIFIGDINDTINLLTPKMDYWFFDGFKPSTNTDLWSFELFTKIYEKCNDGAKFSTFSVAKKVIDNLSNAGFYCEKIPGFGNKKQMLRGWKNKENQSV